MIKKINNNPFDLSLLTESLLVACIYIYLYIGMDVGVCGALPDSAMMYRLMAGNWQLSQHRVKVD